MVGCHQFPLMVGNKQIFVVFLPITIDALQQQNHLTSIIYTIASISIHSKNIGMSGGLAYYWPSY